MIYGYTICYVKDVAATIKFYEDAFGFAKKFITPESDYAELVTGSTTLAFASMDLAESNFSKGITAINKDSMPAGIEIAFVTDNIKADLQKALDAGATLFEPLKTKPWGQQVAYVRDIDGMLIEICTAVGG